MDELGSDRAAYVAINTRSDAEGVPVVIVSGELDVSNVDDLKASVASVTAKQPELIIFDLSDLRYMDSAGIAVLLSAAAECAVRLRDPSPAVRRVVELTGLTDVLPLAS
jgi:anti-sigma B factor antagonist